MNAHRRPAPRSSGRSGLPLAVGLLLVLGLPLPVPLSAAQERISAREGDPEVLLERARYEEDVRGDLQEAIRLYRRVVENHGERRDVAARALLELAEAYELLGREGVREPYRRILADYGDQVEAVEVARTRLAALGTVDSAAASDPEGFTMRRLWTTPVGLGVRSLSPDGRRVAFVDWGGLEAPGLPGHADVAIYELEADRGSLVTHLPPQSLEETYPSTPVWSRDGRWLTYSHWDDDWTHQRLHLVRADGSENRVLVDNEQFAQLLARDFSSSGTFIVVRIKGWDDIYRIALVSTEDGEVTVLKTGGEHPPHPLSLSPDDRFIVFDQHPDGSERHDVFALAVDGSGEFTLARGPADDHLPYWTPDGENVVFVSDRSGRPALWSVPVEDGRPAGDPRLVREDVGAMYPLGFLPTGGLYYRTPLRRTDVFTAELDLEAGRSGEPRLLDESFVGKNMIPAWGPDGERLAFLSRRGPAADEYHLVVKNLATGEERAHPLPFVPAQSWEIDWSDDGDAVLLESGSRREWSSFRVDSESGEVTRRERRVPAGIAGGNSYAMATERQAGHLRSVGVRLAGQNDFFHYEEGEWSVAPDETLLWVRNGVKRFSDGPGAEPEALTPLGHMHTWRLSPDGTTLALAISSDPEVLVSDVIYLLPVAGGEPRKLAHMGGEEMRRRLKDSPEVEKAYAEQEILAVRWTPDGERLLYAVGADLSGRATPVEFWVVRIEGGEPERLDLNLTLEQFAGLSLRADGGAVAFTDEESLSELWLMEGLEW